MKGIRHGEGHSDRIEVVAMARAIVADRSAMVKAESVLAFRLLSLLSIEEHALASVQFYCTFWGRSTTGVVFQVKEFPLNV